MMVIVMACRSGDKDYLERMAEEHENDTPVSNVSMDEVQDSVTAETVTYATVGDNEITGYLAKPAEAEGDLPGIIVIHEWWGLNDNIRMMARKLAAEGYTALAVDLYNGKVAETSDQARQIMSEAMKNEDAAVSNLKQAHAYLVDQYNAPRTGVIGWCFGGGWSLQTALALPGEVDATVIYYGRLETDPGTLEKLQMPVLGIFGSEDRGIPPSTVNEFEAALNEAGVENSIHIFEGANHAFANPSGSRYMKEAAEDAWKKTVAFFEENLKSE